MADRDGLLKHLKASHAFIEETDAFGYAASHGILECAGSIWNIDESKAAIAAYEASPHPAASDEWKQAVDDELVSMQSTSDSYPTPKDAIRDLIGFHVDVATNPQCNGGYSLQPAASDVRDAAPEPIKIAAHPDIFQDIVDSAREEMFAYGVDRTYIERACIRAVERAVNLHNEEAAEAWACNQSTPAVHADEAEPVKPETVAWLIESYDANDKLHRRVVLSPLTDDVYLDESAEAIALCRMEDATHPASQQHGSEGG